jgi:4-amino-4-deoxy-L-arabinose transferase-like glycosyltransferase
MFRYNNPDALLTFLGLAAAWALWNAVETGRTRMLVLAAALTGLAFDTKMLQAFLVLPGFILVYLVAGPPKLGRRIAQLAVAAATLLVSAGWWVAIVTLWPASSRPYIGSSSDNSLLSLIFGYNGLGRLFGQGRAGGRGAFGGGGGPPGGGGAGFGGSPGWLRMFNSANGGEIAWLIPLAVLGLVAGLWMTRRAPRTDRTRAGWLLWGGWALVCYVVFSKAQGIYHPYYTVQLAPAVAALAGAGGVALWKLGRTDRSLQMALPAALVVTAALAVGLLRRTPAFDAWLRPWVIGAAALAAAGVWVAWQLRHKRLLVAAGVVGAVSLLAGPAAYATSTITSPQGGAIVAAGPSSRGIGFAGPALGGLRRGGGTVDAGLIRYLEANQGGAKYLVAAFGSNTSAPIIIATGKPVVTIGGFNGGDPAPTLAQFEQMVGKGEVRYVLLGGAGRAGFGAFGGGPGGGGTGQISQWVTQHGTPVPASAYGGAGGTLYELSGTA